MMWMMKTISATMPDEDDDVNGDGEDTDVEVVDVHVTETAGKTAVDVDSDVEIDYGGMRRGAGSTDAQRAKDTDHTDDGLMEDAEVVSDDWVGVVIGLRGGMCTLRWCSGAVYDLPYTNLLHSRRITTKTRTTPTRALLL